MFLDTLRNILGLDGVSDKEKVRLARHETEKLEAAERAMDYERLQQLYSRFEGVMVDELPSAQAFTDEETIDLGKQRKDVCIYNRPFKSFVVTELYPNLAISPHEWGMMPPTAYLRFNSLGSSKYKLRHGEIRGNFHKVYLTNTAQVGCSFTYVIGVTALAHYGMRGDTTALIEALEILKGHTTKRTLGDLYSVINEGPKKAETPSLYEVEMPNPDTEYFQALPTGTKMIHFHLADYAAFRYAWVTGKVETPTPPVHQVVANHDEQRKGLYLVGKTLYFADDVGTKVMQIEAIV